MATSVDDLLLHQRQMRRRPAERRDPQPQEKPRQREERSFAVHPRQRVRRLALRATESLFTPSPAPFATRPGFALSMQLPQAERRRPAGWPGGVSPPPRGG
jgi:hypothetical protein